MERVSAEDIRAALSVLRPLFEGAAVIEPEAETAAGDQLRLRSETFLLETPEGDRAVALELAGTSGSLGRLRELLYLDELTGVFNRRYLDEFRFLARDAEQNTRPVGLIMLDLRRFKQINDSLGHLAGARVGMGECSMEASICVTTINGLPAARQAAAISFCTAGRCHSGISFPRSPRAMTMTSAWGRMSAKCAAPSRVSIFANRVR